MPMNLVDFDPPMPIGTIIADRYEVTGFLGRGGMGFVVAARHRELGERVAIKFLHRSFAALAERFFREARAAAGIESDHVVRIYDAGRLPSGQPYIVMEHLRGEDLAARLETTGAMSPETVVTILVDICLALAEAHAAGIVHRDLKPENIFLARRRSGEEIVKLLDFGIAKVPNAGAITETAYLLGTPAYMSPEQLLGSRDVDQRSDIWSLGIILYELLTDELPFEGDSMVHLAILIREKPTPRVRRLREEVPEELDAVIARCLAKERSDRYADVGELAEALAPFLPAQKAPSVPRIRRIINERPRFSATLVSTMAPEPSEPIATPDDQLTRESPFWSRSAKLFTPSGSPDSHRASGPVHDGKRRRVALLASLVFCGIAAIAIARRSHPAAGAAVGTVNALTSASSASAPARTPAAEVAAVSEPLIETSTSSAASALPGATIAGAVLTTATRPPSVPRARLAPRSRPSPVASATPNVTQNCNPPFMIDENGVRRVKRECL
jgi:serine/threonine-protein kinase